MRNTKKNFKTLLFQNRLYSGAVSELQKEYWKTKNELRQTQAVAKVQEETIRLNEKLISQYLELMSYKDEVIMLLGDNYDLNDWLFKSIWLKERAESTYRNN